MFARPLCEVCVVLAPHNHAAAAAAARTEKGGHKGVREGVEGEPRQGPRAQP